MATNFPGSLDAFTNPTSADTLDNPPHDQQHADVNDAVEAIETALLDGAPLHIDDANERVGVGTASPSYKLDVDGDINTTGNLRFQGTVGYTYVETVYFTSSGTFTKASYPWLRAIRIRCQGGGGGGCGRTAGSHGTGGAGGGYAEKFLTDIAGLSASETVTVGAGGAGGANTGASGSGGGGSSFASVVGNGGGGGNSNNVPGIPSSGSGGDVHFFGSGGGGGGTGSQSYPYGVGHGGASHLGGGAMATRRYAANSDGYAGYRYGGGGGGACALTTNQAGGAGADGIVILELYA
jgi:hypothetical protein